MTSAQDSASFLQSNTERERLLLARYAMHSFDSRGRHHEEILEHPYRGPFQRDRDRILHSSAFRRLSGKMQVFTGDMGDYHRTRLTHTHEVASIARTIARALRLNEDLVEALALFHDIGHPPFGHAGEDALNECLKEHGGFSHNRYALTLANELEQRYPGYPGLNLTREVLESQAVRIDKLKGAFPAEGELGPLLEAQVVEAADSVTYDAHDADDSVKLNLVTLDELCTVPIVQEARTTVRQRYTNVRGSILRRAVVHELIDRQVRETLTSAELWLREFQDLRADEVRRLANRIEPSGELADKKRELERFLYARVYRHEHLLAMRSRATEQLRRLFVEFQHRPELLPTSYRHRAEVVGLPRAVGDYLAGMTDRFCTQRYVELCGENSN
jgi:dGTPase